MKNKDETETLNAMILAEKLKHAYELEQLKDQFYVAYESIKPINLVKNLFHEITTSPEIKNNLVNNVIGLGTGFLTRSVLLGTLHNPITRLFGNALQFSVANIVSKHSEKIKLIGGNLFNHFKKKLKPDNNQNN